MSIIRIPAVLMRGGTSKGLFLQPRDLPWPDDVRDRVILRAFGSPDPSGRQVDGIGGATSTTSKVVVVGPSSQEGCDVDYFFGQVAIDRPLVDTTGSCGNLSAAVGPFAIEAGLVPATDPVTTVRIWQVNTRKRIVAHVPTAGGAPLAEGDHHIDGVPFPGSEVRLEYLDPGASCAAALLPTGRVRDRLDVPGIGAVDVTLVDASNPVVIVAAADVGMVGTELEDAVDGNAELLRRLEAIRAHGAVAMGLARTAAEATAHRPATPKMAVVAPPAAYRTNRGTAVAADDVDLVGRIMSMGRLHKTYAVTGAIATAVAALLPGSVAYEAARPAPSGYRDVRIGHPGGIIRIGAEVAGEAGGWRAVRAVATRTARRLMEGVVLVPSSVLDGS